MPPLRPPIFLLLLICCSCVPLHAQNDTSCKAPGPVSGQTKEEQDAAASGYLAACKAASAPDAHEFETAAETGKEAKSGAHVDDAVDLDVLALPVDFQAKWGVNDYLGWIRQLNCPKLSKQARQGLVGRTPASQKIFLAFIVQGVQKFNKCN